MEKVSRRSWQITDSGNRQVKRTGGEVVVVMFVRRWKEEEGAESGRFPLRRPC